MEINQYSGLLTWTPLEGVLSSGNISIKASDGEDVNSFYDIQNFAISVTSVNDSPLITSSAPTNGVQNQEYIYEITVDDPDDIQEAIILGADGIISNEPGRVYKILGSMGMR